MLQASRPVWPSSTRLSSRGRPSCGGTDLHICLRYRSPPCVASSHHRHRRYMARYRWHRTGRECGRPASSLYQHHASTEECVRGYRRIPFRRMTMRTRAVQCPPGAHIQPIPPTSSPVGHVRCWGKEGPISPGTWKWQRPQYRNARKGRPSTLKYAGIDCRGSCRSCREGIQKAAMMRKDSYICQYDVGRLAMVLVAVDSAKLKLACGLRRKRPGFFCTACCSLSNEGLSM